MARYAEVIVPVPLPATFTYLIPQSMDDKVRPLHRVVVPFGGRKWYTAIVTEIKDRFDGNYDIKEIAWCPDKEPILRRPQLQLWQWIADYYMCAIGDVFKAALPAGLKIETETIVEVNSDFVPDSDTHLSATQTAVWEAIKVKEKVSLKDLERDCLKDVIASVYSLMETGAVTVREKMTERFRPKKEEYYTVTLERGNPQALQDAFASLKRSTRRQQLLMTLLHLSRFNRAGEPLKEVTQAAVRENECYDRTILRDFVKKGFIRMETREVSRFKWADTTLKPLPTLSTAQAAALDNIHKLFTSNPVVLLHGVTSSGKTEIYIHLIDYTLRQGKQTLFLVPEIALTTQLTKRLQDVFGPKVVIYHSRFSDAERGEIWRRLLNTDEPLVIIGARSSVFLPFARLGLVIVDEEHEQSYKQFDPAPRYNARDVATVLSRMHGAKTLLASATPSVETYSKAGEGRYGLVELTERYAGVVLPETEVVDVAKERRMGRVVESLAVRSIDLTKEALGKGEQVIFFHNRRGFSPIARCKSCEYIPKCTDCDVSLSYHKRINRLVCHYCGKEYALPATCPVCQQPSVEVVGFGTERIEDNVAEQFPGARILRMDLDTTRNKENYSTIIEDFSKHLADILVGTQMVTKGLDFGDVSTVIVLNADMLMNYPDFRATERAFNMLEQVAGRAGRRAGTPGKVIIQTRNPEHPVLRYVLNHDYAGYYEHELEERRSFAYPPFTRIIYVFVRHKDAAVCQGTAAALASQLTSQLGNRILGPHEPAVNRIKNMYIRRIMVKIEPGVSISQVKDVLKVTVLSFKADSRFRSCDFYFDVDPM